ncbi:MAG: tartrate dehydrogenase [SAR202 cluster bacterium]|nr:tartrate dehydrogenase [SAR202 cluster bacterium]
MSEYNIAVIRGDGIGPEVIEEGLKVLNFISKNSNISFSFVEFDWGSDYYFKNGFMMPDDGLNQLLNFDSIYLGAVGHPELQDHITLNGLLLPIRRKFDQYVCERPSTLYQGVTSPLKGYKAGEIDFVVIRENTEGEYANIGGFQYFGDSNEIGIQTGVFTKRGCERVINYAFQLARKRGNKKLVTSVTKSNAQGYGMVVWDRAFDNIARNYPDIKTESLLVDAACMDFIRKPEVFDVVVASNLFGDILTDIGAIITGSMGLAPSGNIDPSRNFPSMFEPVHGSAPDIVDQGVSNPLATIFSGAMMLDHLGESSSSKIIQSAVEQLIKEGNILTKDLGGTSSTSKVGDSVVDYIKDLY